MRHTEHRLRKLGPEDYRTSAWSGGTTTQLAIWPPEAVYADRRFLWRVSSATVELERSDFTPLPDYDRLISTLDGAIVLTHNGGAPIPLRPFAVHAFSGADATCSEGRCRDFNLMLRRGAAAGSMEAVVCETEPVRLLVGADSGRPCEPEGSKPPRAARSGQKSGTDDALHALLYCAEGVCTVSEGTDGACPTAAPLTLAPGESLLVTGPAELRLTGPARLMLCRMRTAGGPAAQSRPGE